MTYEEKYNEKLQQFEKEKISLEEWQEFCTFFLELILEDNTDILKRLKGEW